MYDPLCQYISLVNVSINPITLTSLPYQLIVSRYILIGKDSFNLIDKLSCQPGGCQATPRALGDIEYIITLSWNPTVISYRICIIIYPRKIHK